MTGIIKERRSANVGGVTVFTYEGAEAAYKSFAARVYAGNLTMEACTALGEVEDVMHGLGYTWEQINDMEIEAVSA